MKPKDEVKEEVSSTVSFKHTDVLVEHTIHKFEPYGAYGMLTYPGWCIPVDLRRVV